MKCVVITPVGPGHQKHAERAAESVRKAFAKEKGPFDAIEILAVDDTEGRLGRSKARNQAVRTATQQGADWLFFLDADDLMAPNAFAVAPKLIHDYDAIWGEIFEVNPGQNRATRREGQASPITDISQVLGNDPFLTLQMGHFVRASTAMAFPFNETMDVGEDFDYYLRIWKARRCIKVTQPLFFNVRGQHSSGPKSATGANWRAAMGEVFGRFCAKHPLIATINRKHREIRVRIGNPMDTVQRHLVHGRFFEEAELEEVIHSIPAGAKVLDIGSNIGNHALFLACCAEVTLIHCYEPATDTADLLAENFALNQIDQSRYSIRRMGIGGATAKAQLCAPDRSNIGANFLRQVKDGDVLVDSLDHLYPDNEVFDFIKIDVEGMELDVLAGASSLIARSRPTILVEVSNANKEEFLAWVSRTKYRIHRVFELVNASNYLLLPYNYRAGFFAAGAAEPQELTPKVPLARGQPAPGWDIGEFLRHMLVGRQAVEIVSFGSGRATVRDVHAPVSNAPTSGLSEYCRETHSTIVVLQSILRQLDVQALEQLLSLVALHAHTMVLMDIMDARWLNTFPATVHIHDVEHYVMAAESAGFRLKGFQKIPYKAGYQQPQLDARITVLEFTNATG